MNELKKIIVSKTESVYETVRKLTMEGELNETWLLVSHKANSRMKREDKMVATNYNHISPQYILPEAICSAKGNDSSSICWLSIPDEPQKIILLDAQ